MAPEQRKQLLDISVKAVLEKAIRIMGAGKPSAKRIKVDVAEDLTGELIIEDTLENTLGKSIADSKDIIVEVKKERRINAALMIDTSISMTGRKLAWAAVSAAVLAQRISLKDSAVISFESTASVLKPIGKTERLEKLVERTLTVYATGYTNIEDGLKKGLYELRKGSQPEKVGIIITDGKYTEGGDPLDLASRYRKLYVLMTKDYNSNESLCRKMASQGGGQVFTIAQYEEIPHRLYRILNDILK
jgi:Mg-chelatase subunit ChlD